MQEAEEVINEMHERLEKESWDRAEEGEAFLPDCSFKVVHLQSALRLTDFWKTYSCMLEGPCCPLLPPV